MRKCLLLDSDTSIIAISYWTWACSFEKKIQAFLFIDLPSTIFNRELTLKKAWIKEMIATQIWNWWLKLMNYTSQKLFKQELWESTKMVIENNILGQIKTQYFKLISIIISCEFMITLLFSFSLTYKKKWVSVPPLWKTYILTMHFCGKSIIQSFAYIFLSNNIVTEVCISIPEQKLPLCILSFYVRLENTSYELANPQKPVINIPCIFRYDPHFQNICKVWQKKAEMGRRK